jgi:hypothetical protein
VNLKQLTKPSSCMSQKCESMILKQSTSYKESMDYKNIKFRFVEQKILNKQYRIRV